MHHGHQISKVGDPEASTDKAEQTNGAKDAGDEEGKANVQAGGSASKKEVTGDLSKKLKEQEEEKPEPTVAFLTLFRFTTKLDYLMIFLGCLGGAGSGAIMPLMQIFLAHCSMDWPRCPLTFRQLTSCPSTL